MYQYRWYRDMEDMTEVKKGSLKVVGTGISVSGQMTLYTQSVIKHADVVLSVVSGMAFSNLRSLNPNIVDLKKHYHENTSRFITYQNMKLEIMEHVIAGKNVVAAFYGHPGVFVTPSHDAIKELCDMGYRAEMLPGVSAEDCLVADLGLDPARHGCQSYEATKFLFRKYRIDPHMMQIIWQIGGIAEFLMPSNKTEHPGLPVLRDELLKYFPAEHEVIVYEAATMPVFGPSIEKMPLQKLGDVKPGKAKTLVIPALCEPEFDVEILEKFGLTPELIEEKSRQLN